MESRAEIWSACASGTALDSPAACHKANGTGRYGADHKAIQLQVFDMSDHPCHHNAPGSSKAAQECRTPNGGQSFPGIFMRKFLMSPEKSLALARMSDPDCVQG